MAPTMKITMPRVRADVGHGHQSTAHFERGVALGVLQSVTGFVRGHPESGQGAAIADIGAQAERPRPRIIVIRQAAAANL